MGASPSNWRTVMATNSTRVWVTQEVTIVQDGGVWVQVLGAVGGEVPPSPLPTDDGRGAEHKVMQTYDQNHTPSSPPPHAPPSQSPPQHPVLLLPLRPHLVTMATRWRVRGASGNSSRRRSYHMSGRAGCTYICQTDRQTG